ncbi:MAG: ABC transporter ATP-binding protein [Planctomycetota bacterium]
MRQNGTTAAAQGHGGVRVAGVTHRYRAGAAVLTEVDAEVTAGAVTALVGPNGAGKTTLLRVMAGLVAPTAGEATLSGEPIGGMGPLERAGRVVYLPQRGGVAFGYTAAEVVAMGAVGGGVREAEVARSVLGRVGLGGEADRVYDELSGGQRQRVRLARAYLQAGGAAGVVGVGESPAGAMLLDEPVAGLDPAYSEAAMAELSEWARAGWAVAVVLHDVALAGRWADRAIVMEAGRVVASGPAGEVLTADRLGAVYRVPFGRHVNGATGGAVLLPTRDREAT